MPSWPAAYGLPDDIVTTDMAMVRPSQFSDSPLAVRSWTGSRLPEGDRRREGPVKRAERLASWKGVRPR